MLGEVEKLTFYELVGILEKEETMVQPKECELSAEELLRRIAKEREPECEVTTSERLRYMLERSKYSGGADHPRE